MFRKLFASVIAALALLAGTLGAAPACADPTGTFPDRFVLVELKALANERAFALGYIYTNTSKDLVGFPIDSDGLVGNQVLFESSAQVRDAAVEVSPLTVLNDGSLALAWTAYNNLTRVSTISASFSADGASWSQTSHPAPTAASDVGPGCATNFAERCYYAQPRIAQDGKGLIGVAWTSPVLGLEVKLAITKNKQTWSTPAKFDLVSTGQIGFKNLRGLTAGGFNLFGSMSSNPGKTWMARTNPTATKLAATVFWADPNYGEISTFGGEIKLSADVVLVPLSITYRSSQTFMFAWATYSPKTGIWSKLGKLAVPNSSFYLTGPVSNVDLDGRATLVFKSAGVDSSGNATNLDNFYSITFEPGAVSPKVTLIGSRPRNFDVLQNIYVDADNQLHLLVHRGTQQSPQDLTLTQSGLESPQNLVSLTSQIFTSVRTPSGNQISTITASSPNFPVAESVLKTLQSDRPRLMSSFAVTGTAKVKSRLTVGAAAFIANQTIDPVQYNWYACASASPKLTFQSTMNGCSLIGSGVSTYVIKAADKNKFIAVSATATSSGLSTTVFSHTTVKVK